MSDHENVDARIDDEGEEGWDSKGIVCVEQNRVKVKLTIMEEHKSHSGICANTAYSGEERARITERIRKMKRECPKSPGTTCI